MSAVQGWIALVGGLGTALLGLLKYFNYRSRRDRISAVGLSFNQLIDSLASADPVRQSAAAILLRRFFDPRTEQGVSGTPYQREAVAIIAALLRTHTEGSELQKLLADGLAYAPTLRGADLQQCCFVGAYLGRRTRNPVDLSDADLFEADLTGASLREVIGQRTVFYRATLRGTVFEEADLTGADFREADLEGARFRGARLTGARFADARGMPASVAELLGEDSVAHGEAPRA